MEQKKEKLITELNKLITNELITSGGVHLPEVGSLSVESSKGATSRRTIVYTKTEMHTSLVAVIAVKTKCSVDQASKLYALWLEGVTKSLQIEIEGIGTLRGGRFEVSNVIEERLNPVPAKAAATKEATKAATKSKPTEKPKATPKPTAEPAPESPKKGGRWGWILLLAAAAAVAAAIYIYVQRENSASTPEPTVAVSEPPAPQQPQKVVVNQEKLQKFKDESKRRREALEAKKLQEEQEAKAEKNAELRSQKAKETSNSDAIAILNKSLEESQSRAETKYKVIYGVYKSKSNAGRAIVEVTEAIKQEQDPKMVCGVFMRGETYMVSVFESDHFYTSVSFMKRNNEYFSNSLWVYDPEKM